jgi:hypothetical protein
MMVMPERGTFRLLMSKLVQQMRRTIPAGATIRNISFARSSPKNHADLSATMKTKYVRLHASRR